MKVIKPETKVLIDEIEGTVLEVLIGTSDRVNYKVGWWNGRTFCSDWFPECMVECYTKNEMTVGF